MPSSDLHKAPVQARITAQLGMERKRHHVSFSSPARPPVMPRHHLDFVRVLNGRGANENPRKGLPIAVQLEGRLEALQLPAVSVAADGDWKYPQTALARGPLDELVPPQDHPPACAE